jgi:hypothetical protein
MKNFFMQFGSQSKQASRDFPVQFLALQKLSLAPCRDPSFSALVGRRVPLASGNCHSNGLFL